MQAMKMAQCVDKIIYIVWVQCCKAVVYYYYTEVQYSYTMDVQTDRHIPECYTNIVLRHVAFI